MPSSDFANIPPIMAEVQRLQPYKVIDLGIGMGKYGALCREVLDGIGGRFAETSWRAVIHGVEGFEEYNNPIWDAYDFVTIANIKDYRHWIVGYDLVLMIDSLEHLDEQDGVRVLDQLVERNHHVIVSVPLGKYPQGAVHGNDLETHRRSFFGGEFSHYDHQVLHKGTCLVVSIKGKG